VVFVATPESPSCLLLIANSVYLEMEFNQHQLQRTVGRDHTSYNALLAGIMKLGVEMVSSETIFFGEAPYCPQSKRRAYYISA